MAGKYPDELIIEDLYPSPLRDRLPYEIHYRMPRKLAAPFMASHFVQLRRSVEERNFAEAAKRVTDAFTDSTADENQPSGSRETLIDESFWRRIRDGVDTTTGAWKPAAIAEDDDALDLDGILKSIQDEYRKLLELTAAIFVFGTEYNIIEWIMRRVTDVCGRDDRVDEVMKKFDEEFRKVYYKNIEDVLGVTSEGERPGRALSTDDFGGVRHWLETRPRSVYPDDVVDPYIVAIDQFGTRFDDFKHYRAAKIHDAEDACDQLNLQVRWTRHPHSWTYTLIESPAAELSDAPNHSPCPPLSPRRITDFLLTAILNPSVATSTLLPQLPSRRQLAGHVLAGAHYLMIRVEDLMAFSCASPAALELSDPEGTESDFSATAICQRIQTLHRTAARSRPAEGEKRQTVEEQAAEIARSLQSESVERRDDAINVLDACMSALGPAIVQRVVRPLVLPNTVSNRLDAAIRMRTRAAELDQRPPARARANAAGQLTVDRSPGQLLLGYLQESSGPEGQAPRDRIMEQGSRLVLGEIVRAAIASDRVAAAEKAEIHRLIADLTRAFWHATFRHTIDESASAVGDDFVSSAMADGRCVYFSNFMPFGDERFTRTIFVDIELGYYQRARVLQRLSDILTYRSVPLHDHNRVTTAIDSLIDMNRLLNDVQVKLTGLRRTDNADGAGSAVERSRKRAQQLQEQLDALLRVSVRAGRLNDFFTYGIAGKAASAEAYYEQIVERTQDIREERLLGYMLLSDFLTRRLKHSIRFVERLNMHHMTVSQRTGELLDRVRTQLDALRAQQLVDALEQQRKATETAVTMATEQVRLTRVAEILVVVGGTYYAHSLLGPLFKLLKEVSITSVLQILEIVSNYMPYALLTSLFHFLNDVLIPLNGVLIPVVSPILDSLSHYIPSSPTSQDDVRELVVTILLGLVFYLFTRLVKDLSHEKPPGKIEAEPRAEGQVEPD